MKKLAMIFSAAALLVLPATAMAHQGDGRKDAVKKCKAVASKDGGGHGKKCKSERARLKQQLRRTALKSCKGELADDVQAFVAKYGPVAGASNVGATEPEGSKGESPEGSEGGSPQKGAEGERPGKGKVAKAFKKCVKQKVKAAKKEQKSAAKECRVERARDPEAFRAEYGTNANKRNAFGKCVSQHAREGDEPTAGEGAKHGDDDTSPGDDAEDKDGAEPDKDGAEPDGGEQEDLPEIV